MKRRLDRSRRNLYWRLRRHNSLLSTKRLEDNAEKSAHILLARNPGGVRLIRRTATPPVKFCAAGVLAAGGTNVQSNKKAVFSMEEGWKGCVR